MIVSIRALLNKNLIITLIDPIINLVTYEISDKKQENVVITLYIKSYPPKYSV